MRTRALRHGLPLTEIGLGTAQLGNLFRETTEVEADESVETAWEGGIRYFDTAPHYGLGLSERRLGERLADRPRGEYVISTKVGRVLEASPATAHLRDDDGFDVPRDVVRRWDFSRDGVLRSVEDSLRRTGLDRFDILYLHDPDDHFEQASTEGIGALIELRDQGVVSAVGAGMNADAPLAELIRRADVDVVMCAGRYTLLDDSAAADLLPLARERGVRVVAAGVFNSGLLGAPRPPADATYDYRPGSPEILARANAIADVAERYGVTLPDLAVAFALRHPAVVSVVLGARGRRQVAQNLDRAATPIPDDLWDELAATGLVASRHA
ncbi:aldo/keto reductase [Microbacterium testaceum]|uniref:aldo/keto reductase n=1 Tax=Microbacterium testaceum TaxID=2033 RepID=UPI000CCF6836|nr:aldo/keto reductase [Microbacterium testaceum]PNW10872.1 aldo/keto reductase [Microbacterium testaceum]